MTRTFFQSRRNRKKSHFRSFCLWGSDLIFWFRRDSSSAEENENIFGCVGILSRRLTAFPESPPKSSGGHFKNRSIYLISDDISTQVFFRIIRYFWQIWASEVRWVSAWARFWAPFPLSGPEERLFSWSEPGTIFESSIIVTNRAIRILKCPVWILYKLGLGQKRYVLGAIRKKIFFKKLIAPIKPIVFHT